NPWRPFHGGEIRGRGFDFIVGHRFGERDHAVRITFSSIGALSQIVFEIHHGLNEIRNRKSRYTGVLGPAFTIGIMAETACIHLRIPSAMSDDFRHLRMVSWKPVRRSEAITNLRERE